MNGKMAKKTILNIRQQAVMGKLALAHQDHRRALTHLRNCYREASEVKLPISQVGKRLRLNKSTILRHYQRAGAWLLVGKNLFSNLSQMDLSHHRDSASTAINKIVMKTIITNFILKYFNPKPQYDGMSADELAEMLIQELSIDDDKWIEINYSDIPFTLTDNPSNLTDKDNWANQTWLFELIGYYFRGWKPIKGRHN